MNEFWMILPVLKPTLPSKTYESVLKALIEEKLYENVFKSISNWEILRYNAKSKFLTQQIEFESRQITQYEFYWRCWYRRHNFILW